MGDFKKLHAWQAGMELAEIAYQVTSRLPAGERFGLQSQIRRAAVSVPTNLAEGTARGSDRDFLRFVRIARASVAELESLGLLCVRLGLLNDGVIAPFQSGVAKTSRLLLALQRSLGT